MRIAITSEEPGVAWIQFEAEPDEARVEDLAKCPAIWQMWQVTPTLYQVWSVPRYPDEVAWKIIRGWLTNQTGMMGHCAKYAVLPPADGLWIGSTVFPLFLTDQSQLDAVQTIPHIRQVECLNPDKGIFQVHTMPWNVNGVINDIRTRLSELATTR